MSTIGIRMTISRTQGQRFLRWIKRSVLSQVDPHARGLKRVDRAQLLQPSSCTQHDRHPQLFAKVATLLQALNAPDILSFGCSTGEEAFTLSHYFPGSRIDAIDINPHNILIAQKRARRAGIQNIHFACASRPPPDRMFDAIFALSVFRHGDLDVLEPDNCHAILPFAKVEAAVGSLDVQLREGGLLAIWGSQFHFADFVLSARYSAVHPLKPKVRKGVFYDRENWRSPNRARDFVLFRKLRMA